MTRSKPALHHTTTPTPPSILLPAPNARSQTRRPRLTPQPSTNDDNLARRNFAVISVARHIGKLKDFAHALQHLDPAVVEHDAALDAVHLEPVPVSVFSVFLVLVASRQLGFPAYAAQPGVEAGEAARGQ